MIEAVVEAETDVDGLVAATVVFDVGIAAAGNAVAVANVVVVANVTPVRIVFQLTYDLVGGFVAAGWTVVALVVIVPDSSSTVLA